MLPDPVGLNQNAATTECWTATNLWPAGYGLILQVRKEVEELLQGDLAALLVDEAQVASPRTVPAGPPPLVATPGNQQVREASWWKPTLSAHAESYSRCTSSSRCSRGAFYQEGSIITSRFGRCSRHPEAHPARMDVRTHG